MTNHAAFERLVATGLDFSLETHDATAVDEHLATCPACRAIAAGYRADAARLRAIAFVEPPDRVRAAVFGAAARPRPGGWTPLKLLLAAALLLAALAGTTVAVGTLLRLVATPISPVQWSAVPWGAALVQDNGTPRLERVAASGDRFVAIGSGSTGAQIVTSGDGGRGIEPSTAAPSAAPSSSTSRRRGGVHDRRQLLGPADDLDVSRRVRLDRDEPRRFSRELRSVATTAGSRWPWKPELRRLSRPRRPRRRHVARDRRRLGARDDPGRDGSPRVDRGDMDRARIPRDRRLVRLRIDRWRGVAAGVDRTAQRRDATGRCRRFDPRRGPRQRNARDLGLPGRRG